VTWYSIMSSWWRGSCICSENSWFRNYWPM